LSEPDEDFPAAPEIFTRNPPTLLEAFCQAALTVGRASAGFALETRAAADHPAATNGVTTATDRLDALERLELTLRDALEQMRRIREPSPERPFLPYSHLSPRSRSVVGHAWPKPGPGPCSFAMTCHVSISFGSGVSHANQAIRGLVPKNRPAA
jgi:hypothetical protein